MADSWFDDAPEDTSYFTAVPVPGIVNDLQAYQITQLVRMGWPPEQIAAHIGIPVSAVSASIGQAPQGPVYDTVTNTTLGGPQTSQSGSGANDPLAFIKEWQASHPATRDSFQQLATELKNRFGIDRFSYNGTPSNNEFLINGEKVKVMGAEDSSSPYWFAYGSDDGWGSGPASMTGSLGSYLANAPSFSAQPYTPPEPFSYKPFEAGTPFTPPSAESVLNDPGVMAALKEGQRALESSASARGTLLTGRTGLDISGKLQDRALGYYDDAFSRDLNTWQANEGQRYNDYLTDRNNAFQNYTTNAGIGFGANQLNNNTSLAAYQANLGGQNQYWNQARLGALDQYGQGQDYINNLFRYYSAGQSGTGVPAPYTGTYRSLS